MRRHCRPFAACRPSARAGLPRVLALAALTATLVAFAACGGGGQQPSPGPPATNKIAFVGASPLGGPEIFTISPDGSELTNITNSEADDGVLRNGFGLAWSPDATRIAFVADRFQGNTDIFVMNADGSGLARLTDSPNVDYLPAWSPDGERIVYISASAQETSSDIYVMAADGSDKKNLTESRIPELNPSWSPDGERIVYSQSVPSSEPCEGGSNQTFQLYLMDADGSNKTPLSPDDDPRPHFFGAWSPDGDKLAFRSGWRGTAWGCHGDADVFVADSDGSDPVNVSDNKAEDYFAGWSPAGDKIAIFTDRDGNWEIYTVAPDGSNLTNVTNSPESDTFGSAGAIAFAWSPDGSQIAFARDTNPELSANPQGVSLWIMNADGSGAVRLAESPSYYPVWSP